MRKDFKIWIVRAILIALIIFWMFIIFGFSAENGTESQSFSDEITFQVIDIIQPDYAYMTEVEQTGFFGKISFLVRKIGHFGEYAILGVLLSILLLTFGQFRNYKKNVIIIGGIATAICAIYAITDEFHQGFVADRSPRVMDVGIDTLGALCGCMIIMIIFIIIRNLRKKGK